MLIDEIDQAAIHQLDHAAAETGRRQRAGDREPDGRVVLRRQHLVGENVAGLRQPAGVERLKSAVDQRPHVRAAARTVITNRGAFEIWGGSRSTGRSSLGVARDALSTSRRAVGHVGEPPSGKVRSA